MNVDTSYIRESALEIDNVSTLQRGCCGPSLRESRAEDPDNDGITIKQRLHNLETKRNGNRFGSPVR